MPLPCSNLTFPYAHLCTMMRAFKSGCFKSKKRLPLMQCHAWVMHGSCMGHAWVYFVLFSCFSTFFLFVLGVLRVRALACASNGPRAKVCQVTFDDV